MANRAHVLAVLLQMSEVHRDCAFLSCSQGARNDCPPNARRLHDRMYAPEKILSPKNSHDTLQFLLL